ncbi:hypothetical protein WR25_20951 isoform B [Diploscapter pachys]|uniref:Carboxylic ester hydrolase n=1 Tax=Diploscapter pachys TaxID=2018661 RepID=A0A2A2LKG3_9BILA|nr:hypothetical protein WR25_20951 isoform A [Diploscapter pachys]PAV86746.1 hypothetical protein WR25_20951 isoform B [Diploscapter pachys]
MVYVHGGGFTVHSSANYGDTSIARNLCTKGVLVCTINYRLGVMGFFTTGDQRCLGNFGLWDQTLALRWIKDNVSRFGGDPNCITLFGQSAGGASVDWLSISPHSRDLFQRVIPMGGCGECDFAIRTKENQTTLGREFARFLGWKGEDSDTESLLEFMKAQPTSKLELGFSPKKGFRHSQAGNLYFVPNFDGDFFPKQPSTLRQEMPKKDVMCGTTHFEGLLFVSLGGRTKSLDGVRKFTKVMYKECDFGEHVEEVRKEVFDFYTRGLDPKDTQSTTLAMIKLLGDYAINVGVFNYAKIMASLNHNVYFYSFEYCNPDNMGFFGYFMPFKAATHCTELRYVLGKGIISKFKPNDNDLKMIEIMTTYFTSFAKYGDPNGKLLDATSSFTEAPSTTDFTSTATATITVTPAEKTITGTTTTTTSIPSASSSALWLPHSASSPLHHFRIDLPNSAMKDDYQERRPLFFDEINKRNLSRASL